MGNSLAIATVTAALRNLLMQEIAAELPDAVITVKPPHKARRDSDRSNQLNLFLYQTAPNTAWRDRDTMPPSQASPLALNLYYFITAYGRDDDDLLSHQLLGSAMASLRHHPILMSPEMRVAVPGNTLHQQLEQVRVTPHPMTAEELSKIWSIFQFPYSLSMAYQVSVVLLDSQPDRGSPFGPMVSQVASATPAQVATASVASTVAAIPALTSLDLPNQQSHLFPGDLLTMGGHYLHGDRVRVHFQNLRQPSLAQTVLPVHSDSHNIKVQFPPQAANASHWAAGFYTVAAAIHRVGAPGQHTNQLICALAPRILTLALQSVTADSGTLLLLKCSPPVLPEQTVTLIVSDSTLTPSGHHYLEVQPQPHSGKTETLQFMLQTVPAAGSMVLLRIDGVDSPPFWISLGIPVDTPLSDMSQEVNLP